MFKPIENNHNFIKMEKKWLAYWYDKGIVEKYLKKNNHSKKYFSFLDGPITANNPMGVHHAWGRTYKDLWQRFFNLWGYRQRFHNGFDCQGLWVEVEVEKELGLKTKKDIENLVSGDRFASIAKFVNLCKQRVIRFSKIQTEQSKRLGYLADWDHSYYTMSDENNYMIWTFLKKCYLNGWIYKGKESVPWCPRCQTAISQHEILTEDYKEIIHESVYMRLKIKGKDEYLLVWTTTPWTIPANIAVAADDKVDYSLVETKIGERLWLARNLINQIIGSDLSRVIKTVKGKDLVGLKYLSPFDHLSKVKKTAQENPDKFHLVISTDKKILPINLEEGTGLVHIAVSAGTEDYRLGKKLGLPMIPIIDDEANYLEGLDDLSGKNAKNDARIILDQLEKRGFAYKVHPYRHRYPVCWRCKTELVWKLAEEWYIAMDRPSANKEEPEALRGKTLRQRLVRVAKKINWIPAFGLERELDWLKNMNDWLISKKNRFWGLCLPIYECKECGFFEVIGSKEELKERAVAGWEKFEGHSPHKPYLDEVKIRCRKCQNLVYRIDDVGNPWLDAGIVAFSTITQGNQGEPLYKINKREWRKWFPADFITESFPGQFKNWFYALIAMSTVMENEPPFKTVLGFGTLLGEDGRPMHKSWGNMIEFNEGADKIGVDVMRWMFARQNPAENMLFGFKKADEVRRQFYLLLWNVYKFFVDYANFDKFSIPSKDDLETTLKKLDHPLDRWILSRFAFTVREAERSLKVFDARKSVFEIEKFVSDLSTWYLRRSRNRVWVNNDNRHDKMKFYSTLYYVLVNLSIILSVFIPFLSEEIYTNLTKKDSVHLDFWPKISQDLYNPKLESQMELIRKIVEKGHYLRKELKIKVRMPLLKLEIDFPEATPLIEKIDQRLWLIALEELNIKNLYLNKKLVYPEREVFVSQEELEYEGRLREFIRLVQSKRKEHNLKPVDYFDYPIPPEFKKKEAFLKKKLMLK
ncbi:MAG: isoleucine--tRNA ligase [Patescibacteria group bacterium]|nr:isoleucine--tRNA ligase [Patescibacteria group bacterium]